MGVGISRKSMVGFEGLWHVGSLQALNEVFYQIITPLPTVIRQSGTANAATLRSFGRRSYGYKVVALIINHTIVHRFK